MTPPRLALAALALCTGLSLPSFGCKAKEAREPAAPRDRIDVLTVEAPPPEPASAAATATDDRDAGPGDPTETASHADEICVHLRGPGFDGSVECTVHLPGGAEFRERVRANPMTDYGAIVCVHADERRAGIVQCGAARVGIGLDPKKHPCATITRDRRRGTLTASLGCNGYD